MNATCGLSTSTPCTPQRRMLFGPVPTAVASVHTLATDQEFALTDAGRVPLRVVATIAQQAPLGEHGDTVWIRSHASSLYESFQAATEVRIGDINVDSNALPHALPVKMRVQRCSWPGWFYVDAGSGLYMPGGETFDVQLVAPVGWTQAPGFPAAEVPFDGQLVDVRVGACVARCCPPRRQTLTMYASVVEGEVIQVPRGAVELWIVGGTGGGLASSVWEWITLDGATVVSGPWQVNNGFINAIIRPGEWDALRLQAGQPTIDATFVWQIEGE